jgi:hypothetical protein
VQRSRRICDIFRDSCAFHFEQFFPLFFCLETKETKVQGSKLLMLQTAASAKRFELAALKQQIFLHASAVVLLNATKFKA